MNLLFVHDHPFYKDGESIYSGGGLPSSIWNNYLINFDEVSVFGRLSENLKDRKTLSSSERVSFVLTEHYKSIKSLMLNIRSLEEQMMVQIKKCDVILIRLPSILGVIAGRIAIKQDKKVWVEQVGNAKEALLSYGSLLGKIGGPILDLINKKLVKKADFVSYVTETKLQKYYPTNSYAITASISNVNIHKILNNEELNKERFFNKTFKIGLIGGFDVNYKGQDVLLNAIANLDKSIIKEIELYFVGKGDFERFEKLAISLNLIPQIKFFGALQSGEAVNKFLEEMSLYVQPSLTEGMPRATIEAMSMGCPVIGSNVGGIPDIVDLNFVHNRGDYIELSKHITELYLERDKLFEQAQKSLLKAQPFFFKNLVEKRIEFYKQMNRYIR